jgi:hypothetical protein
MTPQAMMQIKSFKIVGSQVVSSQFHVSLRIIEGYSAVVRACCCVSSAVDCTRWRTMAPAVQGRFKHVDTVRNIMHRRPSFRSQYATRSRNVVY